MLEVYINPKFKSEATELKTRVKNFNLFQYLNPVEFKAVNQKNEIKFDNNIYRKDFNIMAN